MAYYFYVKSGLGTKTADETRTAPETGAFGSTGLEAADVYANFDVLQNLTTPPVDGDFVYCSDVHAASYSSSAIVAVNVSGVPGAAGLTIVSVDDGDVSLYSPGASEDNNAALYPFQFRANGISAGVDYTSNSLAADVITNGWTFQDCTLKEDDASDDALRVDNDASSAWLVNVILECGHVDGHPLKLSNGAQINWRGGSIVGSPTALFADTGCFVNGGGSAFIDGVDLSNVNGTMITFGSAAETDSSLVRLTNCLFPNSYTLHNTILRRNNRVEAFNCDEASGVKHAFYVADGAGSAQNNDTVYVTATKAWYDDTDKSSIEVITSSLCGHVDPFIFELPMQYVDLSDVTKDTLTLDLTTNLTLTDTDIAAFLVYPDGTNDLQANWVTSGKTPSGYLGTDPMPGGSTLPNSVLTAGDWTGETTSNFYELVLDTSVDAGQATAVGVRIEVYKPSIDGTTNKLFIHPLITVSAS
jgi:hypothetical protein